MSNYSMKKLVLVVSALLFTFVLKAQDCKTTVYLDAQTVKSGDAYTSVGGTIINEPGKQFVVESNGNAALAAGKRIELNYGFKAAAGSVVKATVEPCDPDGPVGPGKDNVVVYPNPTDGLFSIKSTYTIDAIRLSDSNGALQLTQTGINDTSVTLDISKLNSGYYLLEIIVGKAVTETVRIQKK